MLSNRQVLLIKLSWSHLSGRIEDFGDTFYKILFELDPALKRLFKSDPEIQQEKFASMVNHIVAHVQHTGMIEAGLQEMGERHEAYGVKPEHYDTVLIAFLLALERMLKKNWDSETKEAWTMAVVYIISQMRKASRAGYSTAF